MHLRTIIALALLTAPTMAQDTIPKTGYTITSPPGLEPTITEYRFQGIDEGSQAEASHSVSVGSEEEDPVNSSVFGEAAISVVVRWKEEVDVTGFAKVAGQGSVDIQAGSKASATAYVYGKSEVKYGRETVLAEDKMARAVTSYETVHTVGAQVSVLGSGGGATVTWKRWQPNGGQLWMSNVAGGDVARTTSANITIHTYAGIELWVTPGGTADGQARAESGAHLVATKVAKKPAGT